MKGKFLTLIGTALTLALTTNVAMAESSQSPMSEESSSSSTNSPTEIKMSPLGMKILCERFPLNSRCPGGTALNSPIPTSTTEPAATPTENGTSPESTTVPGTTPPESGTSPESTTVPAIPNSPDAGNSSNLTPMPGSMILPKSDTPNSSTESGASSPMPVPSQVPAQGTL
ncbi:hypothetical protein [Trichormus variabilis]|uniref:Uncharacterized protein n=1 Tax=Trichormus variabilis SAG 1403-4b TaxID=447716 RepID=A0A3S1AAA1_ANAVA|nr:hypothetical protein [Trichormus variabilis]MBD2628119.1 hypothetical protein [Trichormus variabilis FACHB-164]RUS96842.1 hypothetical protein DSM107003_22480 [Trichormus variabilis SAG 1403-4b]